MTVIVFQTFAVILQTRRIQYVVTTRQNPELLLAGIDSSLVDSVVGDENVLDAISEYLGYLDLATKCWSTKSPRHLRSGNSAYSVSWKVA